jgi:Eukaryotic translation initiation factor 3 subunit G
MAAVDSARPQAAKLRWGELDEDDGGDLDFLLPPRVVEGPDENGIKRTIEYKFDDEGNKVRVTTTTRVRKLGKARVSKKAKERRNWAKFGDALREDMGSRLTMVSTEEILLERPRAPGLDSSVYFLFIVFIDDRFLFTQPDWKICFVFVFWCLIDLVNQVKDIELQCGVIDDLI